MMNNHDTFLSHMASIIGDLDNMEHNTDWYLYFNLSGVRKPGSKDTQYRLLQGILEKVLRDNNEIARKYQRSKNIADNKISKIVVPLLASEGNKLLLNLLDAHRNLKQKYFLTEKIVSQKNELAKNVITKKYQHEKEQYESFVAKINSEF